MDFEILKMKLYDEFTIAYVIHGNENYFIDVGIFEDHYHYEIYILYEQ